MITTTLYVAAYLFVGAFVHWAIVRIGQNFEYADYKVPMQMAEDGGGQFLFAFIWPFATLLLVAYLFAKAAVLAIERTDAGIFDLFDYIWNKTRDFLT